MGKESIYTKKVKHKSQFEYIKYNKSVYNERIHTIDKRIFRGDIQFSIQLDEKTNQTNDGKRNCLFKKYTL